MKKNMVIILILSIILITNIVTLSYGLDLVHLDEWQPDPITQNTKLNTMLGMILGIVKNIGIIVSVIGLMIIGIKSMFGSIEEKSEYKELLPRYILGAIVLVMCTSLPSIIYELVKK